jgi:type IV secretory pathway VirB10-like protein
MARPRSTYVSINAYRQSAELLALNLPALKPEGRAAALEELAALAEKLQKPQPHRRALAILSDLRDEAARLDEQAGEPEGPIDADDLRIAESEAMLADTPEPAEPEPSDEPAPEGPSRTLGSLEDRAAARALAKEQRSEQAKAKRQARQQAKAPAAAPAEGLKRCAGLPTRGVDPHDAALDRFGSNARMPDGLSRVCRDCNATYARLVKEAAA